MPLADFQERITGLVRDDTGRITAADEERALADAVEQYSKDRPRHKAEDFAAIAGAIQDLPPGWQVDFSKLISLESPIGDSPPTLIPSEEVSLYLAPAGEKIMTRTAIGAGRQVRATYTIRHALDGSNDTIPSKDREAVSSYAAAILCDHLASIYSASSDSTIQADAVEHRTKAQEFASRARTLRKLYYDQLGVDPKRNVAAGVVVSPPRKDSTGWPRLTHPN
jgi:hypothetical protein